jgi:hypothetical protein
MEHILTTFDYSNFSRPRSISYLERKRKSQGDLKTI